MKTKLPEFIVPFGASTPDSSGVAALGQKGHALSSLSRLGLNVPPGFVLTVEACRQLSLGDAEIVNHTYRIENVATQPTERITANDEERQRQGFELQTTFEWAIRDHVPDVRRAVAVDAEGEIARLAYGPGATITRMNSYNSRCVWSATARIAVMKDSFNH